MQKIYLHFKRRSSFVLLHDRYFFLLLLAALAGFIPRPVSATGRAYNPLPVIPANAIVQAITVNGTVTDEDGAILPGVNIIEKGTTNGAVTDAEGKYKISVASGESVLVFSFVGTVTQLVTVGGRTDINIQLKGDAALLSEVVVVGYGTQERKDVTGAMTSVKSEEFNKGIINSPEQLLQGKVAGLNITSASGEPGAAQTITIRGPGGIRTGNTPLFVVDGFALDNANTTGGLNAPNPLNFLNPQDIESIDVLKDASATAIYGARGANGVVLITTKKGKAGRAAINYSASLAVSNIARKLPVFSADEFRQRVVEVGGNLQDLGANTDWQDMIMRSALTQNHNLSFSGGADKLSYYASLGLQDQEGIMKNSNMKKYSGRINLTQKFLEDDRLSVDLNLNATNTINERPPIIDVLMNALPANPTFPAFIDDKGTPYPHTAFTNPLTVMALNKDVMNTTRILGNISPSFTILKGLVYKLNFGIDHSNSTRDEQQLPSVIPVLPGKLTSTYAYNNNSLIENYITYAFGNTDHSVNVLAGHSYQKIFLRSRTWSIGKFPVSDVEPINNPGLGQELTLDKNKPTGFATKNELQSFFGRVNYSYKDRYLFTATVRADGSSKFGDNNKYGTFPSFSVGWTLSEENFMKSLPVSTLKLRAGWGQTGNQEIPSKITKAYVTSQIDIGTSYPLSGSVYPPGTTFARLANADIQWEVSTQTNIGLDFGFLNGALTGSVDAFNKESGKILLEVVPTDPIQPSTSGKFWTNVKDMTVTNRGLELALNYRLKVSSDLTVSAGGNITFISNEVKNSPFTVIPSGVISGSGLTSANVNGYVNGEPIGTFFLKEYLGMDENGATIFRDVVPDGVSNDADRIAAGSALPTKMYNFNVNAAWKGFDLAVNFNGVSGNKVYDNTANAYFYKAKLVNSQNTTIDALTAGNSISTQYLKNGAFLRLNNLSLGYNFNTTALGINGWVNSLRLSVTGQNLFVITDYEGYDPEVNTDRPVNGISSYGMDYLSYPKARTFVFGLNVGF